MASRLPASCGRGLLQAQPGAITPVPPTSGLPPSAVISQIFPSTIRRSIVQRVKRFVIAGHFNLPAVEKMLAGDPTLINGAIDWGNGDFERR